MIAAPRERHLPAAVIDPRLHNAATCAAAARVVPAGAQRLTVGRAQLGYRKASRGGGGFGFATCRLHEIERVIHLRHGGPCDTDDAEAYFALAVHSLVSQGLQRSAGRPDPVGLIIAGVAAWCARWLLGLPRYEMMEAIDAAIAEPRFFRADTAAKVICLTMAERTAADVRTIGATDVNAEERARLRKEKHAADAQARRDAAAREFIGPKPETVEDACARLGISRATFYRRRKAAALAASAERDNPRGQQEVKNESDLQVAHENRLTGHGGAERRADEHDSDPTQPLVPAVTEAQAIRTYPARWIAEALPAAAPAWSSLRPPTLRPQPMNYPSHEAGHRQ